MKIAVNYGDLPYKKTQHYNTKSAYRYGGIDKVFEYAPKDIDEEFKKKNISVLKEKRGGGYWLWKPYVLLDALNRIDTDDYLFYSDSGSFFINKVDFLINCMETHKLWLMSFGLPYQEVQYTKRDIFEYFNMYTEKEKIKNQRLATFILIKKNNDSVEFVKEYLEIATQGTLITDAASRSEEDERFIENRHDQSIFSLLCKKWNIPYFREPSEFGTYPQLYDTHPNKKNLVPVNALESPYPQILVSHRRRNHIMRQRFLGWIRRTFPIEWWINFLRKKRSIMGKIKRGKNA